MKKKPSTSVNNSYNLMNSMSKSVNTSKVNFNTNTINNASRNSNSNSKRNELLFSKLDNKQIMEILPKIIFITKAIIILIQVLLLIKKKKII